MNVVNGLPLHPLLVHAVVVLMPLTAVAVVLHALWPVAARRLGVVTPLAALGVLVLVPITQQAGSALARQFGDNPAIAVHAAHGRTLLPWAIVLFVVALALWLWHGPVLAGVRDRSGSGARVLVRVVLIAAALAVAIGSVISVVLTGDSGARAVWGGGGGA